MPDLPEPRLPRRPVLKPSAWSPRPIPQPAPERRTADPKTPTLRELAERERQRASLVAAADATRVAPHQTPPPGAHPPGSPTESGLLSSLGRRVHKMVADYNAWGDRLEARQQAQMAEWDRRDGFKPGTYAMLTQAGMGAASLERAEVGVFSAAGAAMDRAGFTRAGRALAKHGGREGSAFPRVSGTPDAINHAGRSVLDDILNHPGSTTATRSTRRFGTVTDVRAPDGRGARFGSTGEFIGLLEP